MDNFPGIFSLLTACIEVVLLINLFIFSEKNRENRIIYGIVTLLLTYQLLEFTMCYFENYSHWIVYTSFLVISFLPPLLLLLAFEIKGITSKIRGILFLPIVLLLIYYLFVINGFEITSCTPLFASYEMPLGDFYGLLYYSPILITVYLLSSLIKIEKTENRKINLIILLSGILIAFVPIAFIIFLFPDMIEYVESFFCKGAILIAIMFSLFAMRNKKLKDEINE